MASLAVLLFSSGIDSTTTLALAIKQGFSPIALTFDYGQRHRIEIEKSSKVLEQFPVSKQILFHIDLKQVGGSALTSPLNVPKHRSIDGSIPVTYVPGRNLIFLSIAAAIGEVHEAYDLFYGANILDFSGYPDCRPEFIQSLERTLNIGTKAGVEGKNFRIHAPLLKMTKAEIIKMGMDLGVDYTHTHSCYDPAPDGKPCDACDSCVIRRNGFAQAGFADPALRPAHE